MWHVCRRKLNTKILWVNLKETDELVRAQRKGKQQGTKKICSLLFKFLDGERLTGK
jgi:hypothetical protein